MREVKFKVKQKFFENGQICYETYRLNGKLHNENGPAVRKWDENGQLRYEGYFLNDVLHNENGPAVRKWDENGQVSSEYWLNDKKLTKEEFENRGDPDPHAGKKITLDGKEYTLTPA